MSFIGRGEQTVAKILERDYHFAPKVTENIYQGEWWYMAQVPFTTLISDEILKDAASWHQKTSVDFICRDDVRTYAIYVNGREHHGEYKAQRDKWRYETLKDMHIHPVIVDSLECPTIFSEMYNKEALREFELSQGNKIKKNI